MEPRIFVGYYTNKTLAESDENRELKLFSRNVPTCIRAGDVIVSVNKDTASIVRVSIADGVFELRHLLDPSVFTGEDSKYHKSELKLKSSRVVPGNVTLMDIGKWCGISPEDKTRTNVNKCTAIEYAEVFYKGERAPEILETYRKIVLSWV